ncbi:transposase [Marinomonas epiphytica]
MPTARNQQICLEDTPYYHCISRCVRRAYLCGEDHASGVSYEHRREWVEKRLWFLSKVFSIDICAYAVMQNHIHVVLHINSIEAEHCSLMEVIMRWHRLHKGTCITQKFLRGEPLDSGEKRLLETLAETYRNRLASISWFMKELNEPIARWANTEDDCTGHFWEGRFKSQALLDESALMACMAYVDLNPLRVKESELPEKSNFTSFKQRVISAEKGNQPVCLFPFLSHLEQAHQIGLPFALQDYLTLVDITGKAICVNKKGVIDMSAQPILQRINVTTECWLLLANSFEKNTKNIVGQEASVNQYCLAHNRRRRLDKKSIIKAA